MPTTADYLTLWNPGLAFVSGAYTRFGNLVKYYKWLDLCQCVAAPSTCIGPAFGDGSFSGFGCASGNESIANYITIDAACTSPGVWFWNFQALTEVGTIDLWDVATATLLATSTAVTVPASSHAYKVWDGGTVSLANGQQVACSVRKVNLSCYPGSTAVPPWPTLNPLGHVTAGYYNGAGFGFPATSLGLLVGTHPELCSSTSPVIPPDPTPAPKPTGFPDAPAAGTCTTVQDVCNSLLLLDRRVSDMFAFVKTIQRYRVPFGVVEGTLHTGLSGTGSLTLPGIVGLRVTITTNPPGPVLTGNPPYLWDRGWLSVNDAAGMLAEKRLTRTSFEWFPETPGLITTFQWSLTAGVVIEVQELEPVP